MPVKIWLPWELQVTWAVTCHIKWLPDKFWKKPPSLVAFALILRKLLSSKVAAGRIPPPPPPFPPSGLNRVNRNETNLYQYADDTTIRLDGSEESFQRNCASGLRLNYHKTEALWIGSMSNSNVFFFPEKEI